jgi:hypothetical protein
MLRNAAIAALLLLAGAPWAIAAAPASAPPAAAPVPNIKADALLDYIPANACLIIRVRPTKLAASDLWKLLTALETLPYGQFLKDPPLAMNPATEVTDLIIAGGPSGNGRGRGGFNSVFVLQLNHDVDPKKLFKSPTEAMTVEGIPTPVYAMNQAVFMTCPRPRTIVFAFADRMLQLFAPHAEIAGSLVATKRAELCQPGELVVVGRLPAELQKELQTQMQEQLDKEHRVLAESSSNFEVVLSLDLARAADAVKLDIAFDTAEPAALGEAVGKLLGPFLKDLKPTATATSSPATPKEPAAAAAIGWPSNLNLVLPSITVDIDDKEAKGRISMSATVTQTEPGSLTVNKLNLSASSISIPVTPRPAEPVATASDSATSAQKEPAAEASTSSAATPKQPAESATTTAGPTLELSTVNIVCRDHKARITVTMTRAAIDRLVASLKAADDAKAAEAKKAGP